MTIVTFFLGILNSEQSLDDGLGSFTEHSHDGTFY